VARVTLKDIAHEAGVSVMTVSNVVNGNLGRVSPATADQVRGIVAARGYVPNGSAQSLAAGRTRLVGLLVPPGSDDASLLVSQHDVTVMGAVEATLRQRDNHLMVRSADSADDVRDSVHRWNLDGIVVMNFTDEQIADLDLPDDVPAVLVDAYGAGHERANLVRVGSDDAQGGRLAAEHLLGLGHRCIVFCGPTTTTSRVVAERLRGFREAVEAAGVAWDDALVLPANTGYAEGLAAGVRIAADHTDATAVFATADVLAAGIERGLARAGRSVPGDVSVVGYDDTEIAEYVTPSLTTVAQDTTGKGRRAAQLLLDVIDGKHVRPPKRLGVELVVRESSAAVRAV
jgi:LacI family transcriptional regulator